MIKNFKRLICFLFACTLMWSSATMAQAIYVRSSDYFGCTEVWATATGSGKFIVEFDINATHTMTEVGATSIAIWEKESGNSSYTKVKTFTRYNTSGLIENNSAFAYGKLSYTGKAGAKYYAIVTLYAKDSSGSETMHQDTNTVSV